MIMIMIIIIIIITITITIIIIIIIMMMMMMMIIITVMIFPIIWTFQSKEKQFSCSFLFMNFDVYSNKLWFLCFSGGITLEEASMRVAVH